MAKVLPFKPPKVPVLCQYDFATDSSVQLVCQAHDPHYVHLIDFPRRRRVLLDLLDRGLLVGRALAEARSVS